MRKIALGIFVSLCVAAYLSAAASVAAQPAQAEDWQPVSARDAESHAIHFHAVDLVDPAHGWVGGITYIPPGMVGFEDTGIIGRTDSGGETWQYSTSHETGDHSVGWNFLTVTALDFVNGTHGWATLDDGTILASSDGGARWTMQAEGSYENRDNNWGYADVAMADTTHGVAVGGWVGFIGVVYPRIAYTENGHEWKEADVPKVAGASLESVSMVDAMHGWAVGPAGADKTPLVLVTKDGGATWTRQIGGLRADGLGLRGVCFVDRQHGWAVGDSGTIYVTADGGASWWSQPSGVSAALLDVTFAGSGVGWAVGEKGTLLVTTRAGRPWEFEDAGAAATLRAVANAGGVVWAVGDEGVIMTATVPDPDPGQGGFGDIDSSPYKAAIETLATAGVVGGFKDGTYRPDAGLNRAQFAKMIVGALGIAPSASTATRFIDLGTPDTNGYPHVYVQAAFENGITNGTDVAQTLFAPWNSIRRDQLVSMIVRGAERVYPRKLLVPPADYRSTFDGIGAPHGENLRVAEYNGLLEGVVGVGAGWSGAPATRGEAAHLLYNLMLR